MSKERILRTHELSVIYTEEKWHLLETKRHRAIELMELFESFHPYLYGSVARGNVHRDSDIDIVFLSQIPSFQVELALDMNGFKNYLREIIMATPKDSIRLYIHLNDLECLTVPLTKLETNNIQFYDFGGKIDLNDLRNKVRVLGVDKRLVLIKPTEKGHDEKSILDNENMVAKELGISIKTLNERKKVLLRREKHGRTGVFFKHQLEKEESTEEALKHLASRYPIIRKKLFKR